MLAPFVLLAPPAPTGTTTLTVLCEWLTTQTGTKYAASAELRDYPVFLSVKSGDPGRITALVAGALAGRWERDGKTVRLVPANPKDGEGLAEFARGWKATVDPKSPLAALPPETIYAMRAGSILRFGLPEGRYVLPLPPALKARVEASEERKGYVYLSRWANGYFQRSLALPDDGQGPFSSGSEVTFRTLPPAVLAALGDEAKNPALTPEDATGLEKIMSDPMGRKIDPKTIERKDPLTGFVDPLLGPVSRAMKRDLVMALPDLSLMAIMTRKGTTVEGGLAGFGAVDDLTVVDGAIVGRLPVSERRYRTQTRRVVLGKFVQETSEAGVPSPVALAGYLAAQNPGASECWSDVMMLVMSGVAIDQTHIGDFPWNLRFAGSLTDRDWARLKAGGTLTMGDLNSAARSALVDLMVNARERMDSKQPDPATWPEFPNARLALSAKVEDEAVVVGGRSGTYDVMDIPDAAFNYDRQKSASGGEPLFRPGHRRKLTLTIFRVGTEEKIETGFGETTLVPGTGAVAWRALPPEMAKAFEKGLKMREEYDQQQPGGTP